MLLQAILQGLALGIFLAIQPGPSFFALIQTSSKKGFKSGLALASGIFLSDVCYVALAYLGIAQLLGSPENKKIISLVGGILLVAFGLMSIFQKKKRERTESAAIESVNVTLYITKGFFLNLLNPSVLLLWIFYVGLVGSIKEYTPFHIVMFFITTLTVVFTTDVLKAYYADKISQRLSDYVLRNINILLGLILLITGLVFIFKAI